MEFHAGNILERRIIAFYFTFERNTGVTRFGPKKIVQRSALFRIIFQTNSTETVHAGGETAVDT